MPIMKNNIFICLLKYLISVVVDFSPSGYSAGVSVSHGTRCRNGSSGSIKKNIALSSMYVCNENGINVISMEGVVCSRHFFNYY